MNPIINLASIAVGGFLLFHGVKNLLAKTGGIRDNQPQLKPAAATAKQKPPTERAEENEKVSSDRRCVPGDDVHRQPFPAEGDGDRQQVEADENSQGDNSSDP